jgi:moderate conductance mechanosensitive channel
VPPPPDPTPATSLVPPSSAEVAALAAQAPSWFTDDVLPHLGRILLILLTAAVLRYVLVRAVRRVVERSVRSGIGARLDHNRATRVLAQATGATSERRRQRTETLGSVLRSIITGVVFGIAALMILADLGVVLGPMLASAGVAGVALGFGAQSLVKDFLSGVFMLLEDQYGVGDVVDLGIAIGTVEAVSLRITQVRDANGVVWYVRNGEVIRVANLSQGWSTAVVDLPVASGQDLERVQRVVRAVTAAVWTDPRWAKVLLEEPTVAGVEQIVGTTATIRVLAKTAPNEQHDVQRDLRERCLAAFAAEGVRPPASFPQLPGTEPLR